jgi:anti-anti-sigma factor
MITTTRHDDVIPLTVDSDLDAHRLQNARERLANIIRSGHARFMADLPSVAFADSSGLGALVSALDGVRPSPTPITRPHLTITRTG